MGAPRRLAAGLLKAAIQIAHAKGARIVALIKDTTERRISEPGAVRAIAQSDLGNLDAVVREATNGKGASLALNGVGGAIFATLLQALAVGGRQVVYSAAGGQESTLNILSFYKNQFALFGLDTQKFGVVKCAGILNEIAPMFESGALEASAIAERYPLSEAAQAYARVASGKVGKVVLIPSSETKP